MIYQHLVADKPVNGLQKDSKCWASSNDKAGVSKDSRFPNLHIKKLVPREGTRPKVIHLVNIKKC